MASGNRIATLTSETLFTAAVQPEAGCKVTEGRFEAEPRWLRPGGRAGKVCRVNFFRYECLLAACVPRRIVPKHGVLSVAALWGAKRQSFNPAF